MGIHPHWFQIETCRYRFTSGRDEMPLGDCDMDEFRRAYDDEIYPRVSAVCDSSGTPTVMPLACRFVTYNTAYFVYINGGSE